LEPPAFTQGLADPLLDVVFHPPPVATTAWYLQTLCVLGALENRGTPRRRKRYDPHAHPSARDPRHRDRHQPETSAPKVGPTRHTCVSAGLPFRCRMAPTKHDCNKTLTFTP